jgi:hypothetical protein
MQTANKLNIITFVKEILEQIGISPITECLSIFHYI